MGIIHITEAEAARDFPGLMAKVRAGAQVRIENESESFMIVPVRKAQLERPRLISEVLVALRENESAPPPRMLSESIRLSEARGSSLTLDGQFGTDLEEVVRSHEHERVGDCRESS